MKNVTTVPVLLLSLAGLVVSAQTQAAANDEVKAEIVKLCQAEAQGAIDPDIIAQECIELKLQELSGEAEEQVKEES